MKRIVFFAIFMSLSLCDSYSVLNAENPPGNEEKAARSYYVRCPRFVRPMMEKWIEEYSTLRPDVKICLAKRCAKSEIDMNVVLRRSNIDGYEVMYFGDYCILPVTKKNSFADKKLSGKTMGRKRLKKLFFTKNEEDYVDEYEREEYRKIPYVVYSSNDTASVSGSFATFFDEPLCNLRGKRVSGDDAFLNNAVVNDTLGVTFNAIPNIFDIKTRRVRDGLSLLRVDTEGLSGYEITNNTTIDEMIDVLEQEKTETIPVSRIGITFSQDDEDVKDFLRWIITSGVTYNHHYGFLNLDSQTMERQADKVRLL